MALPKPYVFDAYGTLFDVHSVIEAGRTLGVDQLFMPAVPPEQRDMAAEGWRAPLGGSTRSA